MAGSVTSLGPGSGARSPTGSKLRAPPVCLGANQKVFVEEARHRAGLEPRACLDERPEEVLPAQHAVGQQVDLGRLLDGNQLLQVAVDLLVVRLRRGAPTIEVARRLHEALDLG